MSKFQILLTSFLIGFFNFFAFSQTIIVGTVRDTLTQKYIQFGNVLLFKKGQNNIIAFASSDSKGLFRLKFDPTQKDYILSATHLGYTEKRISITLADSINIDIQQNFELSQSSRNLEEVVVIQRKRMVIKSDTITFRADSFSNGQEKVAEDLLKKIPGLEIDSKGIISVNGKQIDRILIGGDDISDRNYKLLSKNLPANLIDEVQILDRFSNNPILKGIENSDKIALNLNLKKKVALFGDLQVGYALKDRFDTKLNVFSFVDKMKIYGVGTGNNVGIDPVGSVDFLTDFDFSMGEIETLKGYRSREQLNANIVSPPSVNSEVSSINNVKLGALNSIFKTSPKLIFKVQAYYLQDKKQFYSSNFNEYLLGNESFSLSEIYETTQIPTVYYGKVESTYFPTKKSLLKYSGKFQQGNTDLFSNFTVNQNPLQEQLQNRDFYIEQFLNYTQKLSEIKALDVQLLYSHNARPQRYFLNQGLYPELLDTTKIYQGIIQNFNNPSDHLGLLVKYISRFKRGSYSWKGGFDYQDEKIVSSLNLQRGIQENPTNGTFNNDFLFRRSWLFLEFDYRFNLSAKVVAQAKANVNETAYQYGNEFQNKPLLTSSLGLSWNISKEQKLSWSFNYQNILPEATQLYSNYALSSYRNFTNGMSNFKIFTNLTTGLNYSFKNWEKQFFISATLNYSSQPEAYKTVSILAPTYTLSGLSIGKGTKNYFTNFNFKKFLPFLNSAIKLNIQINENNFQNDLNDNLSREVKAITQTFKLSFRSIFNGFINYDLGTEHTISSYNVSDNINRNQFNNSYLHLYLKFSPKFGGTVKNEFYSFMGIKPFHVLGLEFDYQVIKNTFSLGLKGQNLLFNDRVEFSSNTDFSKNTNSYRLNQGFLMLSANYRF